MYPKLDMNQTAIERKSWKMFLTKLRMQWSYPKLDTNCKAIERKSVKDNVPDKAEDVANVFKGKMVPQPDKMDLL